eukprot:GILK01005509.1.p1 GENE.GILK01005509.1~~GILK01005509.1.p1  ORF type:complete len:488 (+),score=38.92 GILK01005509.1:149-1612(+)
MDRTEVSRKRPADVTNDEQSSKKTCRCRCSYQLEHEVANLSSKRVALHPPGSGLSPSFGDQRCAHCTQVGHDSNKENESLAIADNQVLAPLHQPLRHISAKFSQMPDTRNVPRPSVSNPLLSEFEVDVVKAMLLREDSYSCDPLYMDSHTGINSSMRSILLDWMMEVCQEFHLKRESFHLAANFTDRYLSAKRDVLKTKLQLVGVAAMYMAAKLEEVYPPRASDFAKTTDGGYTVADIKEMEKQMLMALRFNLLPPTSFYWITSYIKNLSQMSQYYLSLSPEQCFGPVSPFSPTPSLSFPPVISPLCLWIIQHVNARSLCDICRVVNQLLDVSLLDIRTLQYKASLIAAAALFLSVSQVASTGMSPRHTLQFSAFPFSDCHLPQQPSTPVDSDCLTRPSPVIVAIVKQLTGYSWEQLLPCAQWLRNFTFLPEHTPDSHHEAFRDVYTLQTHHPRGLEYLNHLLAVEAKTQKPEEIMAEFRLASYEVI